MKISPYLVFNGQAEEAALWYADILGGRVENFYRYRDMPPTEGVPPVPEEYGDLIMHCCIDGGKDFPNGTMSIADTLPSDPRTFGNGGHILTLSVDSVEQAERNLDYAFYPADGRYNMDVTEASACAALVNAKHSIPYHLAPGEPFDADLAEQFIVDGRLIVPAGETITIE